MIREDRERRVGGEEEQIMNNMHQIKSVLDTGSCLINDVRVPMS